jgi:hypothetical protein
MDAGFDSALASMEKMASTQEQIKWVPLGVSGAGHDSGGDQRPVPVQFQPP